MENDGTDAIYPGCALSSQSPISVADGNITYIMSTNKTGSGYVGLDRWERAGLNNSSLNFVKGFSNSNT